MTLGFRILRRRRAVEATLVAKARSLPVANLSDCMNRLFAGSPTLRPVYLGPSMAGPAFTVKTRPGDNLMVHKALDIASPGDIVVVDAGGDLTNAIIGELMVAHAARRGLGGIVINGAIRDHAALRQGRFPVFAAGTTHRGPYKDGPGEINVPISLGGMLIEPGDLMLGDEDGLLCIPFDEVETVLAAAIAKNEQEARSMQEITAGTQDRSWIDEALVAKGCEIES